MPNKSEAIKIGRYIQLMIKHRWFIIVPFCISLIVGIYLAITLPRIYQAETLILVEAQEVPSDFVRSLVSVDINARISTISQQIMSRTNLEKIIDEFKLFPKPEYQKMLLEDQIEDLRKRISVKITTDEKKGTDAFSISFKGKEPERVMRIANALASFFINENLKVREAQAIGTSNFLDDELNTMKKRLLGVEEMLRSYREKHMGELPEQLETNLSILTRLQERLINREEQLRNAKSRLADLETQYKAIKDFSAPLDQALPMQQGMSNLEQMKKELERLKTRYTESHPDVIRLKKTIAELEKADEKEKSETTAETANEEPVKSDRSMEAQKLNQILATKREIETIVMDINRIQEQAKIYDRRVENTPKREQELLSLRRDYDNIKSSYSSLLNRKLEAEIAVNMERKQKGEQFRVIDSARVPEKPIEPDMRKLFLLVVFAGLGIGGGIVFLLDFFNTSFNQPEEIESILGLPVLATVPIVYHPRDRLWKRFNQVLSIFSIMVAVVLLTGFTVLIFYGTDQTIAVVRRFVTI